MSNSVATKPDNSVKTNKAPKPAIQENKENKFIMPEGVPLNAVPFFWDKAKTMLLGFTWIVKDVEYWDKHGNDILVDEMWSYRYINGKITNHKDDHFIAYAQLGLDGQRWIKR